jgi:hypothetical protein
MITQDLQAVVKIVRRHPALQIQSMETAQQAHCRARLRLLHRCREPPNIKELLYFGGRAETSTEIDVDPVDTIAFEHNKLFGAISKVALLAWWVTDLVA